MDGKSNDELSLRHRIQRALELDKSYVISRRRFHKYGYEYRKENWYMIGPNGEGCQGVLTSGYSLDGQYLGDIRMARFLARKLGIRKFEKRTETSSVCSIGFNPKKKMWYGWSHRAVCGFKIGDKLFEERYGNSRTPFKLHGGKTIRTLDQARLAAKRFAAAVS